MIKIRLIVVRVFILFCCFLIAGCSNQSIRDTDFNETISRGKAAKLIILDVYQDSCGTCRLIEPTVEKLKSDYAQNPDVVFLKYDLSNPFTIFKSREIAKVLGLEQIYKSQRYSGIVLFIDSKTKQVIDSLIGEDRIEKYNKIIQEKLKGNA